MKRSCPIQGCVDVAPYGFAMCIAHWDLVPVPLKDAVLQSWRGYFRAMRVSTDVTEMSAARTAWVAAIDAAVAAANDLEIA